MTSEDGIGNRAVLTVVIPTFNQVDVVDMCSRVFGNGGPLNLFIMALIGWYDPDLTLFLIVLMLQTPATDDGRICKCINTYTC